MSTLLHWLTTPEWSQVVKTLLHSLWQGALLAVALAVTMRRATNPHWRYRFSLAALVAIPVAGIITWATLNTSNRPLPLAIPPPVTTQATTPGTTFNQNPDIKVVLSTNHSPAPPPLHWTAWLALLWIAGAAAMLGRAGIKLAGAEQLRRSGQPLANPQVTQLLAEARRAVGLTRRIRVAVTDKLTSPAVVGVLVPTLILPLSLISTLTPDQIRFILLHELAHIRRGDYFANLFQLFIEALLFFNPAVWWISHQVRREREACCDALAIELSGAPADYARTLIHVAESALEPAPAVAPAFGGGRQPSSLADRVQRLLVPGYRPSLRLTWRAMATAFALSAVLLVLSAEGTRVAVAQITKPQPRIANDNSNGPTTNAAAGSNGLSAIADRFAINDLVTVKFSGTIDSIPQHEERITGDGTITLSLIGAVMAGGKTPVELQKEIHDRYVPDYYKRLTVIVTGEESVSYAGGRVPVRQVYRGATTSAKAIQSAGNFTDRRAGGDLSGPSKINPPPIEIFGSTELSQVDYDITKGKTVVTNGGIVRFNDTTIRADSIQVNQKTGDVVASGNVRLEQPGRTNNTSKLELNIFSNPPPIRVSTGHTNIIFTSERRRAVLSKLKGIHLDRVYFDSTPLMAVVGELQRRSWRSDPDGLGIPIVFNGFGPSSANPDELAEIRVTIIPPLTNLTLMDTLDAVVKGASRPIKFSIEENAVVVSLKGQEPTPLFMREFKVDPTVFASRLAQGGYSVWTATNAVEAEFNAFSIRSFFVGQGVGLEPTDGKSVFYNDRIGRLVIRATMTELDRIGQLLAGFKPEPQINIKIRFVEVTASELETLGPDLLTNGLPTTAPGWAGILTKPQMNQMLQRIQTRQSVRLLSEGEVTTLSERQAQIQTVEIKTIATDINPKALVPPGIITTNKDGSGESLFITTNLSFGPVIDIVPAITPDGYNVALTVIPRMTEFLGYDGVEHPTNTVAVYENGEKGKATYPLPRFRTQQMTNDTVVRDEMTLMLGFSPVQRAIKTKNKVPFLGDIPGVGRLFRSESSQTQTNILFVLVTPTIVAPAAKRPQTSAINKDGDGESFVTSTNLRPIIDYYEPR